MTTGPSSTAEVGYSIYLSPMFHAHVTRSQIQSPNENLYSIVNLHNIENLHDIKNLGRGFSRLKLDILLDLWTMEQGKTYFLYREFVTRTACTACVSW